MEKAKRKTVAESVRMGLYLPDLLAVALLILAEGCGTQKEEATAFADAGGAARCDPGEPGPHVVMNLATRMLPAIIEGSSCFNALVNLALVQRIDAGFGTGNQQAGTIRRLLPMNNLLWMEGGYALAGKTAKLIGDPASGGVGGGRTLDLPSYLGGRS